MGGRLDNQQGHTHRERKRGAYLWILYFNRSPNFFATARLDIEATTVRVRALGMALSRKS